MKKRQNRNNFIVSFIMMICFVIILLTVYFILDVFGIITVPSKYSIASLFYSQIEVIATSGKTIIEEDFLPKNIVENIFSEKHNNEITENNLEEDIIENPNLNNVNPLEELEQLEQELNNIEETNNNIEEKEDNTQIINSLHAKYFYYDQLDEYGKIIYTELYNNIDNLKTGNYTVDFDTTFNDLLHQENGSEILNNAFQLAINALTFDNPELFYLDITKINLITETITRVFSVTYRVSIGGNGKNYLSDEFANIEIVNAAIDDVETIKNDIKSRTGTDVIENLKIVHDYLVDTIEYDATSGKNIYNIYGALIDKKSVCEGYARAYKTILDEIGIESIIVCGTGRNSAGETESHAWNYVKIEGIWYAIDVTWDDPVIIGNRYLTDTMKYSYFLKGSDEFFADHFEDGNIIGNYNFAYPQISKTNY